MLYGNFPLNCFCLKDSISQSIALSRPFLGDEYGTTSPATLGQGPRDIAAQASFPKTEESYVHLILRFVRYHKLRNPREMGDIEAQTFLTYLAVQQKFSTSTQNQALSALLFLYRDVSKLNLKVQFETLGARRSKTLPSPSQARSQRGAIKNVRDVCLDGKTFVW